MTTAPVEAAELPPFTKEIEEESEEPDCSG
jgi:hypothetical protein